MLRNDHSINDLFEKQIWKKINEKCPQCVWIMFRRSGIDLNVKSMNYK